MAEQLVLDVEGMDCGACEQRISSALAEIPGVLNVRADHANGEVRVMFDHAKVGSNALIGRIAAAGFTVTGSAGATA